MTSIYMSPALDHSRERQKGDVAGLLDGVAQAALARSADAGDAARNDLAPLGDERVQHLDVFVVDVVDSLDAEPAHFFAPEILLLLRKHRLVATGGTLRCAAWSSSRFGHVYLASSGVPSICTATEGCAGAG